MTTQTTKKDENVELVDLDVRFVSGVADPATGKGFLLMKSQDGGTPMQNTSEVEKLSTALGFELLKQMVADFLGKAKGKAPGDDAGQGTPAAQSSTNTLPAAAPAAHDPAPATASTTKDGSKVTQQPQVVQGSAVTGAVGGDTVQGQPVTKSLVDEFLARVEAQAVNKEAVEAAREALTDAFSPAEEAGEEEEDMANVEELIQETVIKGLDPIVDAIGALEERLDRIESFLSEDDGEEVEEPKQETQKARKSVDDDTMEEVLRALKSMSTRLEVMETRRQPVIKSRVPRESSEGRSTPEAGVWAGSPFDAAARQ